MSILEVKNLEYAYSRDSIVFKNINVKKYTFDTKLKTSSPSIDKQCFDFSIVDIQEESEFEDVYYAMNMKLYRGQELLCTLFGGYFDERPNTLQATVKSITVYSPQSISQKYADKDRKSQYRCL